MSSSGAWFVRADTNIIHVRDAVGVYATDTAVIQAAFDAATEHTTIILTGTYYVTEVTLNKRFIHLTGPGTIYGGKLRIGDLTTRQDLFISVSGVTFEAVSASRTAGTYGIELLKARAVRIFDNTFINHDKSLYTSPLANAVDHDTAMIDVYHNNFANCNYAWYGDRNAGVSWMHMSDCHFTDNTVNLAYITHVWMKSIDGFHCTGNTFFFPNYTLANATKTNNVYIGQSNWLVIEANNMFESGYEAILLDQASRFTIASNLIAWPGQRAASAAIKMTGTNTVNGTIDGNVLSKITGNGIDIYTPSTGTIAVKNNMVEYDSTTATYYGTPALNTFTHYGVYQDATSTSNVFEIGNDMTNGLYSNRMGSLTTAVRITNDSCVSAAKATVTFTALTSLPVFTLNSQRYGQLTFSGLISLEVKSGDGESGNLATYLLHVSKTNVYAITTINALGLTAGSSANWPSFTFTIDANGDLVATPVASTAGTFYFFPTTIGNLRMLNA